MFLSGDLRWPRTAIAAGQPHRAAPRSARALTLTLTVACKLRASAELAEITAKRLQNQTPSPPPAPPRAAELDGDGWCGAARLCAERSPTRSAGAFKRNSPAKLRNEARKGGLRPPCVAALFCCFPLEVSVEQPSN